MLKQLYYLSVTWFCR